MVDGVKLEKMILASIACDLKLRAEADDSTSLFGLGNGLLDILQVAIKVHRPLVQIASGNLQQPHFARHSRFCGEN